MSRLDEAHLAELHARASELGVPAYRLLRREELIAVIELRERRGGGGGGQRGRASEGQRRGAGGSRGRGGRGGARGGRQRERLREPAGDESTELVTGVLEITPRRYGFLRIEGADDEPDVYVSPAQIRRCELEAGDEVTGPAREPRSDERHRALVHVDLVNGEPPADPDEGDEESDED